MIKLRSYILLSLIILVCIIIIPFYSTTGGLGADIDKYINIAYDLPNPQWSLFPIGYPMVLRFFNIFIGDYYWTIRVVNVFCYILILCFSYIKKFHFKETVLLLSTKIFLYQFFIGASETPLLVCMYFLFYLFYRFLIVHQGKQFSYVPAALLMVFIFMIRYSGLYIYASLILFYLYYYYYHKDKFHFFRNHFFYFLVLSAIGILFYALYNYFFFGDFMGESYRGTDYTKLGSENFYMSLLGVFHSFNPIYFLRPEKQVWFVLVIHIIMLAVNIGFAFLHYRLWKKEIKKGIDWFYIMLIFIGIFYTMMMFASIFFQQIVSLDVRLLSESSFCFFYASLFLYFRKGLPEKWVFIMIIFTLISNSIYFSKSATSFLEKKKQVDEYYSKRKNVQYFYNDRFGKYQSTTYKIPILNKELRYHHPWSELGGIYGKLFIAKDPKIIFIEYGNDTIKDKSKVIYASELMK